MLVIPKPFLFKVTGSRLLLLFLSLFIIIQTLISKRQKLAPLPPLTIQVHVRFGDEGFHFPDLVKAAQLQIDSELLNLQIQDWKIKLVDELQESRKIDFDKNSLTPNLKTRVQYGGLGNAIDDLPSSVYALYLIASSENTIGVDAEFSRTYLFYTYELVYANDLPFFVAQTVVHHFLKLEALLSQNDGHRINLPPNLRVNFRVPSQEDPVNQLDWDSAYQSIFQPFQEIMQEYANVTVTLFKTTETLLENEEEEFDFTFYGTRDSEHLDDHQYIGNFSQLLKFITDSIYEIEYHLGIPMHPDNNLRLKLQIIKRVISMRNLRKIHKNLHEQIEMGDFIDPLVLSKLDQMYSILQPREKKEANELSKWDELFVGSNELLLRITELKSISNQEREANIYLTPLRKTWYMVVGNYYTELLSIGLVLVIISIS